MIISCKASASDIYTEEFKVNAYGNEKMVLEIEWHLKFDQQNYRLKQ
jgi:hypothetical protein